MSTEILLDVESGSVGVGVITDSVLTRTHRTAFGRETPRDARAYLPQLKTTLGTMLPQVKESVPTLVRIVISAPWYLGKIEYHAKESRDPMRLTMQSITALVPPADTSHGVLVESGPIAITINGYHTRVRAPLSGRKVGVRSYTSFIDAETEAVVNTALEKVWPHTRHTYHTFSHLAPCITDTVHGEILVRVGAESTDVCLMFGGTVLRTGMITEGARSVTRRARPDASVDAESRFALLDANELSEKETIAVNKLLLEASEPWRNEFSGLIAVMADAYPIPPAIRLILDHESVWFAHVLTIASPGSAIDIVNGGQESTDVPLEILTRAILKGNE
ncbi:MAG: hypothetical protein AAB573_04825 [Patescibacteria group bacterium]